MSDDADDTQAAFVVDDTVDDGIPDAIETGLLEVASAARSATPAFIIPEASFVERGIVLLCESVAVALLPCLAAIFITSLTPILFGKANTGGHFETVLSWLTATGLLLNALLDATPGGTVMRRLLALEVRQAGGEAAVGRHRLVRCAVRRFPDLLSAVVLIALNVSPAATSGASARTIFTVMVQGAYLGLLLETLVGLWHVKRPYHDWLAGTALFSVNRRVAVPRERQFEVILPGAAAVAAPPLPARDNDA